MNKTIIPKYEYAKVHRAVRKSHRGKRKLSGDETVEQVCDRGGVLCLRSQGFFHFVFQDSGKGIKSQRVT